MRGDQQEPARSAMQGRSPSGYTGAGATGMKHPGASVANSTPSVTPATLATRTAKKTAQTFQTYIQGVNQAAQQAIGEERAKLECTGWRSAILCKICGGNGGKYGIGRGSHGTAAGGGTFDRAGDHAGLSVGSGIGNFFDCRCDRVFDRRVFRPTAGNGTWIASFRNRGYDGSFFCRTGRERDPGIHGSGTADCRIRIRVIWARW